MRPTTRHAVSLGVVWVLAAVYLSCFAYRGWIPHDEGLLAHAAERVLRGELPHRDFDEVYTGGLTDLHALAFRAFGIKLTSLRIVLLLFSLAFVPAVYAIAARVASPALAALVTALCVAWSLPNYFASLPSWYVLFFATFGTLALLRHLDTGRSGWLVVAGLCGGLAFLAKSAGIFYLVAAVLALIHREQREVAALTGPRSVVFLCLVGLGVLFAAALLLVVLSAHPAPADLAHFALPAGALCCLLLFGEWKHGRAPAAPRLARLTRWLVPLGLGAALPIALLVLPYARSGALGDLWRGIFVLPQRRVTTAAFPFPPTWSLLAPLPYAVLLLAPSRVTARLDRRLILPTAAVLGAALLLSGTEPVYRAAFYSARHLPPVVVLAGCLYLARAGTERQTELFLLLAMTAFLGLIQFPYAFGIYFCYVAPVVALATLFLVTRLEGPRWPHLCLLVFYLAFALVWLNTGYVRTIGAWYTRDEQRSLLDLPRGGLRVTPEDRAIYEQLVEEIHRHAPIGAFIYAAPDCPQVYFLSATRNPTRTMYDFFDPDFASDPEGRRRRILAALDAHQVAVVVINWKPDFTRWTDREFYQALVTRFPRETRIGPFSVRTRS